MLSPFLFNIYTLHLPTPKYRNNTIQTQSADDIAIGSSLFSTVGAIMKLQDTADELL